MNDIYEDNNLKDIIADCYKNDSTWILINSEIKSREVRSNGFDRYNGFISTYQKNNRNVTIDYYVSNSKKTKKYNINGHHHNNIEKLDKKVIDKIMYTIKWNIGFYNKIIKGYYTEIYKDSEIKINQIILNKNNTTLDLIEDFLNNTNLYYFLIWYKEFSKNNFHF